MDEAVRVCVIYSKIHTKRSCLTPHLDGGTMNYDGSPYIFVLRKCQKDQIQTYMTVSMSGVAFFIGNT